MSLPMQNAKYIGRAIACSFGGTEEKPQIAVTFEIVDHPEYAGLNLTWFGFFTEKTSDRTIESLQHMGWKGDDLSELELDDAGCKRLLPDSVELVVEPDTYDGKTRLKIRWVNRVGAGAFAFKEPLTGGSLKSFAAQMRGTIKGAQQGNTRPNSGARPNKPIDEDKIPF